MVTFIFDYYGSDYQPKDGHCHLKRGKNVILANHKGKYRGLIGRTILYCTSRKRPRCRLTSWLETTPTTRMTSSLGTTVVLGYGTNIVYSVDRVLVVSLPLSPQLQQPSITSTGRITIYTSLVAIPKMVPLLEMKSKLVNARWQEIFLFRGNYVGEKEAISTRESLLLRLFGYSVNC